MDDFIAGYHRFRASTWHNERARFNALSKFGQKPRALVIGCSDSRTDPQMVFNVPPASYSSSAMWPILCRLTRPTASRTG